MRVPLQRRINRSLLATFVVLAFIFGLTFLFLLGMQTDSIVKKSRTVLEMLVQRESGHLANEIFEGRVRALDLRVEEILALDSIVSVTVYDRSGRPLAHQDRLGGSPPSLKDRAGLLVGESWTGMEKWREIPALSFEAPVAALGEINGYVRIIYSLADVERTRRLSWLLVAGLLATTFLVMLVLLNRLLAGGVVRPIKRLREAMSRVAAEGPGGVIGIDREDEIGDLTTTFNSMSLQLAELLQQVQMEAEERRKVQEELARTHRAAQTLIDTTDDFIIMVDLDGIILAANMAAAKWFGRKPEEIRGLSYRELASSEDIESSNRWAREAMASGRPVRHEVIQRGLVLDRLFYPVQDAEGRVTAVATYGRDVTEIRQAQTALGDRMRELLALNEFSRRLGTSLSLESTLDTILEHMAGILKPDQAMVFLRKGSDLLLKARLPLNHADELELEAPYKADDCLCGRAAEENKAFYSLDIKHDHRFGGPRCKNSGLRSAAALPLVSGKENLGVLFLGYRETVDLAGQANFVEAFGNEAAIALKNALLFEQLRLSEEKFFSAFQASPDSISIISEDGRIVEVNEGFEKITGWSREDALGRTVIDLGLWADADQRRQAIEKMNFTGELDNLEFPFVTKSGVRRQGLLSLRRITVKDDRLLVSVVRDLTEHLRAQEDLRKSREMLDSIIRSIPDILYRLDVEGRIVFINDAVKDYGFSPEELIGQDVLELVHPDDRQAVARQIKERRTGERKTRDLTVRLLSRTKREESFETRSAGIHNEHIVLLDAEGLYDGDPVAEGKFFGTQGIARDITELKNLENQLRQSQKMEAIGTLAGGIAHDFNNILTAILSYAELGKLKAQRREKVENYIDEVLKAGLRARDLVSQILTFSRQSRVEKHPLDMALIVEEALKLLRASIPATIGIVSDIPSGLGLVLGDSTHMHQLTLNLCTNAAHAMRRSGGTLTVTLDRHEVSPGEARHLSDLIPGRYIRLEVADSGEGIKPEVRERIFDPFFTTKGRGEGTGLGLATVHGIVKEMGGAILVDSEVGEGTRFKVLLPVYDGQARQQREESPSLAGGDETLLVVDDEKTVAEATAELLQFLGYKVTSFYEPALALEHFRLHRDEIDLVMTDQTMPGMTGLELGARLRQERKDLPVILMTGFSDGLSAETIKNLGFSAVVNKPLMLKELAEQIRKALEAAG